ncbi:MAG TPA: dipeptide epimerase [Actinokineospora sp.]|nr:dipeptide epimerase [Actinokineospora sp.]
MRLDWEVYGLELATPLRISRSVMARRDAVRVTVESDGLVGHGEVVTSVYYGLDVPRIIELLESADIYDTADLPAGVQAAIDAALFDLEGKRAGVPVHRLLGSPVWRDVPTAYTIGITGPADAARQARDLAARGFSVLKVKVGADITPVEAVRAAAPEATLLIDPNGAWTPAEAARHLDALTELGVDAVEQPIAAGDLDGLAWLSARTQVPLIADEDAETAADVRELAGIVAGVNIKLAKCGGLASAMEIIETARACGMDVMLGCLVASSLGIAPAVHLTGYARWVDLDGHLLLAHDPWTGISGEDGTLRLSDHPGLGVTPRNPTPNGRHDHLNHTPEHPEPASTQPPPVPGGRPLSSLSGVRAGRGVVDLPVDNPGNVDNPGKPWTAR